MCFKFFVYINRTMRTLHAEISYFVSIDDHSDQIGRTILVVHERTQFQKVPVYPANTFAFRRHRPADGCVIPQNRQ